MLASALPHWQHLCPFAPALLILTDSFLSYLQNKDATLALSARGYTKTAKKEHC